MRWFSSQMFFSLQICYSELCMFYHKCPILSILWIYNFEHSGTQYYNLNLIPRIFNAYSGGKLGSNHHPSNTVEQVSYKISSKGSQTSMEHLIFTYLSTSQKALYYQHIEQTQIVDLKQRVLNNLQRARLYCHDLAPPLPLHVSKLHLRHSGRLRKRDNLLMGGGVFSINNSILSDLNNLGKIIWKNHPTN